MVDLLDAARAAGLPIEVTPDFLTNGHNGIKVQSPSCGYLHHTVATELGSVYKAPAGSTGWDTSEWRPTVPSPRCQVYAARARAAGCRPGCLHKGRAHLVFVSAGVAYQAGKASGLRIGMAQRGLIDASVVNAAAAGLDDTMDANDEAMGVEIDWALGEDWPDDLLDLVCTLMGLSVRVFGWPGMGAWLRHRQATDRKVDPDTDFDFWTRASELAAGEDDDMGTWSEEDSANLAHLTADTNKLYMIIGRGQDSMGKNSPTVENYSVRGVNAALDALNAKVDALPQAIGAAVAAALQPEQPPAGGTAAAGS
jgi:hypothetical protein